MDWKNVAWIVMLSASLLGVGCGGDDATGRLGDTCSGDSDCESRDCEPAGGFCTQPGDPMTGCTASTCPEGFTCSWWGASGAMGGPRPVCLRQAGSCGGVSEPGGSTYFYVINTLNIGQPEPGGDPDVVPGFNLDGRVSGEDDSFGCFHPDFRSGPPDNEVGVDNQLGPILSSIGMSIDIEGEITMNINDGTLLIVAEVSGVDDLMNDDCVTLNLMLGTMEGLSVMTPMLGADGLLAPGQTFNIDSRSVGLVTSQGEIRNGRLRSGPVDINLSLPVQGMTLVLNIRQALVRFNVAAATLQSGLIGGALNTEETVSAIVAIAPDDIPESLARSILEGQADLEPTGVAGACQAVSVGLVFDAVEAVRGDTVTPAM